MAKKPLPDVDPGNIRIVCQDPDMVLEGMSGPDSPKLTGGIGGWDTVTRPRQVSMTVWNGVEPYELSFGMILDGWWNTRNRALKPQESVEPDLRDLLAVVRGDGESRPGIVDVDGIPSLPKVKRGWVIKDVQFNDAIRRDSDFHRTRVSIDFVLMEYVPPELLKIEKRPVGKTLGKTVVISAKDGDTPSIIARRRHCDWKDLRKLNPSFISTANQPIKRNTKVRVPATKPK